jgi:phosphoglycerate dehydrogenase-like enzyme
MSSIITFLFPAHLPPTTEATLRAVDPTVVIQVVPYIEPAVLRTRRANRTVTDADRALAPRLTDTEWVALARSTVVVGVDVPDGLLDRVPRLRWVQAVGAGTDQYDHTEYRRRGIALTNGAGLAAVPIAEFVIGRLLEVWKHTRQIDADQRARRWAPVFGERVAGKTLGIVGLGAIGRAVARRSRAFQMTVLATRRSARPGDTDADVDELHPADGLDDVLARADAVVVCAPATSETADLFGAERIAAMRRGAILCNVARGSLVVEGAVVAALESGHLGAAILDVTRDEPTPVDSPLWAAPNCYLSPHSAVSLDSYGDPLVALLADNLARLVAGRPLRNVVTA